jgi:hypothetical protein
MRGQKRLRRTVGARSGDYSERVTLFGTERHWPDWFGHHRAVFAVVVGPKRSAGCQIVEV